MVWRGGSELVQHEAKEVLKQLKANGFIEIRVRGDHHRFTDGKGHFVTVPFAKLKDTIAPGTYNARMEQAGLK